LHAWVVPTQASVPAAYDAFDEDGEPKDPVVTDRLMAVGSEVARFARLHKCGEHLEFLRAWETAPPQPWGSTDTGPDGPGLTDPVAGGEEATSSAKRSLPAQEQTAFVCSMRYSEVLLCIPT
ncbi:MAG: hypothetical protein WA761_09125, partial [Thermoplasmata archaeon]